MLGFLLDVLFAKEMSKNVLKALWRIEKKKTEVSQKVETEIHAAYSVDYASSAVIKQKFKDR